jgi:hypothetical protein
MGLSSRQLALCSEWAWLVLPSTGKSGFGVPAATTNGIPAASRRVGPYRCHVTGVRSARRGPNNEARNLGGTVILATTVAPSTLVQSVLVASSTSVTAATIYPVTDVTTHRYRGAVHHVSLRLSR